MNRAMKYIWNHAIVRTTMIIALTSIFILCGAIFFHNEMVQNRTYYLRNYAEEQQILTEQLMGRVRDQIEMGSDGAALFSFMEKESYNSSNRQTFLIKNERLIFVKNNNEFLRLQRNQIETGDLLLAMYRGQKQVITYQDFTCNGNNYRIGISSDRDFVLLDGKVNKHTTYLMMALAVICGVFFAAIVSLALCMNIRDSKIRRLSKDLQGKNEKLDELSAKALMQDEETIQSTKYTLRENALLEALMKRTTNPSLFPLGMIDLWIPKASEPIVDAHRTQALLRIKELLDTCHVFIEIEEEESIILLYRTPAQLCDQLKRSFAEILAQELPEYYKSCIMNLVTVDYESSKLIRMSQLLLQLRQKAKE